MNIKKIKIPVIVVLIILTGVILFSLQTVIDRQPEKKEILQHNPLETIPSAEYLSAYVGSIALGGFKPLIVDYLWIKSDELKERRQYEELNSLLKLIAKLQPKFIDVWSYNAGVMAYNISKSYDEPQARWNWVISSISYLKEGLLWNPDSPRLTDDIALIYYHRFPQEKELMDKLEAVSGKDCYTIASEWYQETVKILKKTNARPARIGVAEVMSAASKFYHVFELAKNNKFDEAIDSLDDLVKQAYIISDTYKVDTDIWTIRIKGYESIKPALQLEKELSKYDPISDVDGFFLRVPVILNKYKEIIETQFVDNIPILSRIEYYLNQYLNQVYKGIESNDFESAVNQWNKLVKLETLMVLLNPQHVSAYFFEYFKQRLADLSGLLESEKSLMEISMEDPSRVALLKKTIDSYEEYIAAYKEVFDMPVEKERLAKLKRVWAGGK